MTRLHKGRPGPRVSPIDWVALFAYRDQQPLYVGFQTGLYPAGNSIDTSIHNSPYVIAKAVEENAGEFSYTWRFDDWFGVEIRIKLTTAILSGVDKYRFTLQGYINLGVANQWVWDAQPNYNLEQFSWAIVTPSSSFNLAPSLWGGTPFSVMRTVIWIDVPP